ncbi:reductase [Frondihabitans sp. PAMC 28766]|uniref:NAD-dependent epimerase/dehydratase family protein n=1 Tax=Frondihabitans sp. PAMC 28766 TaxID=1795630 RepID=UPI00078B22B7|nr:NAD-dependent epimerase/dehydratase family protein [Frondihabitans sp. PAMC 28766]AMM21451.1 reductase [Frondihabitans sp. PAMC 28766]
MRRILVLGGTGWLGNEVARAALETGAEVVCLARGASGSVPAGARLVRADRSDPRAYDELKGDLGGEWDDVIEITYDPTWVRSALDALADKARHWTLVSTVSVNARNDEPGADESAALQAPDETGGYGKVKVAVEETTAARLGDRLLTVRPGLIAGPGDPSDRFGYWPARLQGGGAVLSPTATGRFVQVIDVADLAAFIVTAGHGRRVGTINAVGDSHPFDEVLDRIRAATGFDGETIARDDAWLVDHGVEYWSGPRSLPLWLPAEDTGFARRSNAAYLAAGGRLRPLRDTIARTLADELARGLDRARRAGLTRADEAALLAS